MSDTLGKRGLVINVILAALAILSFFTSFFPEWRLWGLDYISIVPVWFRIIFTFSLVLLAIPAVGRKAGELIAWSISSIGSIQLNALYFFAIGLIFILSFILPSRNHILGDGYTVLGNIASGQASLATEPLEYLLHHLIIIFTSGENSALNAYVIASHLAFIVFFISLYYFIKDKIDLLLALAVICGFSVMQFFFGYVENYTFAFVSSFIFLYLAAGDYEKKQLSIATLIMLLIAVAFHLRNAVFIVVIIPLLFMHFRNRMILALSLIIAIIGGAVIISILSNSESFDFSKVFVPLVDRPDNAYSFFSRQHILDMFNLVMLNFPAIFLLPFAEFGKNRRIQLFFFASIAPAILFTVLIDPKIGAPRDWDLLSIAAAPVMVSLIIYLGYWRKYDAKARYLIMAPLVLFAMLHTGGWIARNTVKEICYESIRELVRSDIHYSALYYRGDRNKSWSLLAERENGDLEEAVRSCKVRYDADQFDIPNTIRMAGLFMNSNDTANAVDVARKHWRDFIDVKEAVPLFGRVMIWSGHFDEARNMYEAFVNKGHRDKDTYNNLALCLDKVGMADSAYTLYEMALDADTPAPASLKMRFYLACARAGRYKMAADGFRRITPQIPPALTPYVAGLIQGLDRGEKQNIDSLTAQLLSQLSRGK
jgi:tetratricopeptide (TPR) repeat protein